MIISIINCSIIDSLLYQTLLWTEWLGKKQCNNNCYGLAEDYVMLVLSLIPLRIVLILKSIFSWRSSYLRFNWSVDDCFMFFFLFCADVLSSSILLTGELLFICTINHPQENFFSFLENSWVFIILQILITLILEQSMSRIENATIYVIKAFILSVYWEYEWLIIEGMYTRD